MVGLPTTASQTTPTSQPARRAEAAVLAEGDDIGFGKGTLDAADGAGGGAVVDDGQLHLHVLGKERPGRAHAAVGLVPVDDDDGERLVADHAGGRRPYCSALWRSAAQVKMFLAISDVSAAARRR